MSDYVDEVFGAEGMMAKGRPDYEVRPGQISIAHAVDAVMGAGRVLLAEGPCGTGKSAAYLVPAMHHALDGQRTLIVTATIALQEQLVKKDIPALLAVTGWEVDVALLKGRNNYLCLDRFEGTNGKAERSEEILEGDWPRETHDELAQVLAWARSTRAGDKSELPIEVKPAVWKHFAVSSEECSGDKCGYWDGPDKPVDAVRCYSLRARRRAGGAGIVVTNYHMLFLNILVRQRSGLNLVLPDADHVVCDEAHEAAGVARDFLGFTVSEYAVKDVVRLADKLPIEVGQLTGRALVAANKLFAAARDYGRSPAYKVRLRAGHPLTAGDLVDALRGIADRARRGRESGDLHGKELADAAVVESRAGDLAADLEECLALSDSNKVYFVEFGARGAAKLAAKLVDVSGVLATELFAAHKSVSCMSATMTTGGTFSFVRRELGAPEGAAEVVAETPFDFRKQAMLVVPERMPHPTREAEAHARRVVDELCAVVEACGGRTLALFTSYKGMESAARGLRGADLRDENDVPYVVLVQGEMLRVELSRRFKEDVRSVLLGVSSFWTGIDVPGDALTAVVIDKLPFPNMNDPIVDALSERDKRSFHTYSVPTAVMMLRQGVGRLVRSRKDFGVVVILDRRVIEESYGKHFTKSLPDMRKTRDPGNIKPFLDWAEEALRST